MRVTVHALLLGVLLFAPDSLEGQALEDPGSEQLREVLPGAERFSEKRGRPPVFEGYRSRADGSGEDLVGYAFLTSDVPPERIGYNAPIEMLVGIDLTGTLTGVRVLRYHESLQKTRGDFLSEDGFQEQYAGKSIADAFRVRRDVDGISGATITVEAMSLGIRNAARRVAAVHLSGVSAEDAPRRYIGTIPLADLERLEWAELLEGDMAVQLALPDATLTLIYLRDQSVGALLLGAERYREVLERVGDWAADRSLMVFGLDGSRALGPVPRMYFVQGADTLRPAAEDFVNALRPAEGSLEGVFRRYGLLSVAQSLDVGRPFDVVAERCCGDGPVVVAYRTSEGADLAADRDRAGERAAPVRAASPDVATMDGASNPIAVSGAGAMGAAAPDLSEAPPTAASATISQEDLTALLEAALEDEEDGTGLDRALARVSWPRVGGLTLLLALATWAFATRGARAQWITLSATLVFLGFVDRGFLSVSHVASGIVRGPEVYLSDLSLLLIVGFTLVTTLVWGRVFCGFLCPFGALQDFMTRFVPRPSVRVPSAGHTWGLRAKYGILALVLAPALMGSSASLFQYFEPFGTVFFFSGSALLWAIALAFLTASALVPRFYCRYVCPLGAALALGSLLAPFRIRRVEQCSVCTLCERACPTGAIRGARIDFKECVRCGACERLLADRAGSCRHDMEAIRPRLVQLRTGSDR